MSSEPDDDVDKCEVASPPCSMHEVDPDYMGLSMKPKPRVEFLDQSE